MKETVLLVVLCILTVHLSAQETYRRTGPRAKNTRTCQKPNLSKGDFAGRKMASLKGLQFKNRASLNRRLRDFKVVPGGFSRVVRWTGPAAKNARISRRIFIGPKESYPIFLSDVQSAKGWTSGGARPGIRVK